MWRYEYGKRSGAQGSFTIRLRKLLPREPWPRRVAARTLIAIHRRQSPKKI